MDLVHKCNINHKTPSSTSNTFDRVNRTIAIIQVCFRPSPTFDAKTTFTTTAIIFVLNKKHNTTQLNGTKKNGDKIKRNLNIVSANIRKWTGFLLSRCTQMLLLLLISPFGVAKKETVCNSIRSMSGMKAKKVVSLSSVNVCNNCGKHNENYYIWTVWFLQCSMPRWYRVVRLQCKIIGYMSCICGNFSRVYQ